MSSLNPLQLLQALRYIAVRLQLDVALLMQNFIKIRRCMTELWKYIQWFTFFRTQCRSCRFWVRYPPSFPYDSCSMLHIEYLCGQNFTVCGIHLQLPSKRWWFEMCWSLHFELTFVDAVTDCYIWLCNHLSEKTLLWNYLSVLLKIYSTPNRLLIEHSKCSLPTLKHAFGRFWKPVIALWIVSLGS